MPSKKKPVKKYRYRSADTGRVVTEAFAKENPTTTYRTPAKKKK